MVSTGFWLSAAVGVVAAAFVFCVGASLATCACTLCSATVLVTAGVGLVGPTVLSATPASAGPALLDAGAESRDSVFGGGVSGGVTGLPLS